MNKEIKKQVMFVLEDDNEAMTATLEPGSDMDKENKKMNRELIKEHEKIIDKVVTRKEMSQEDLGLIRDANEIHLNDVENIAGHHKQAMKLNKWFERKMKVYKEKESAFDKEGKCLKCGSKVSFADGTDTIVYVGDEIVKRKDGDITNRNDVRCTYTKQYADDKHYGESGG